MERDIVASGRASLQPVRRRLAAAAVSILSRHEVLARAGLGLARRIPFAGLRSRVYRNVSWPLATAVEMTVEVPSAGGRMLVDTAQRPFGRVVAVSGVWEPHVTRAVTALLGPGDVCVDVGAHAGYYTLLASKLVGRDGHVYALEPSPTTYQALCANLARNRVGNVTALEAAAGEAEGTAVLVEDPGGNSLLASVRPGESARAETGHSVAVRSLASVVPAGDRARLRLVKIDVEGFELEVLRGLRPLLSDAERLTLIVELTPDASGGDVVHEVERLRDQDGFRVFRLENEYDVDAYFPSTLLNPLELGAIPSERCDLLLARSRP